MDIKVSWERKPIGGVTTMQAMWDSVVTGRLTTGHAMSSRGLPVAVDSNGNAFGPAETGPITVSSYMGTDDETGLDVHRALDPSTLEIVDLARRAGYDIKIA